MSSPAGPSSAAPPAPEPRASVGGSPWRDAWRALREAPLAPLLLLTVAAAALRILYLDMPMRLDEATTFNEFVLQPWRNTLGKYWATNNHPLHSVLGKLAVDALGNEPWVVRIPAFVAGVLLVPATWFATVRIASVGAAWLAAAGVSVLSPFVLYSTNARGYSLVALFVILQWLALRDALRTGRRGSWLAVAACGALGVYTHLTMAFAYAGNLLWALEWLRRHRALTPARLWPIIWSGALSVVVALVLYLPYAYLSGIDALVGSENVSARSWGELATGIPNRARRIALSWTDGMPAWVGVAVGVWALVALLALATSRQAEGAAPLIATATLPLVVLLTLRLPPPRAALYVFPFILAAMGGAVQWLASRAGPRAGRAVWGVAALPFLVVAYAHLTAQPVRRITETGWMPEAGAIYARLHPMVAPGDAIASFWLPRDILRYYYLRDGRGRAPLVPEVCPKAPATLYFLVRNNETVEQVLRYQRLPTEIAPSATFVEQFGRYAIWRASAPADLRCPERLQGPLVPDADGR